jgi:hypothetical protein
MWDKARPEVYVSHRSAVVTIDTGGDTIEFTDLKFVRGATDLGLVTSHAEDDRILHAGAAYFPHGLGGYNYYIVGSPFPASDSTRYENPEIFYLDPTDSTWKAIAGNPIDAKPGGATDDNIFNSDPSLLAYTDADGTPRLGCYYRERDSDPTDYNKIQFRNSTNGTTWSSETTVLTDTGGTGGLVSPSVVNLRGTYSLYYVDVDATPDTLKRRQSTSPASGYGSATSCTINGAGSDVIWHASFIQMGDKIAMIGTFKDDYDGYFGLSDDGLTFNAQEFYDTPGGTAAWDDTYFYQGSGIWHPNERKLQIFHGGYDGTDYAIGESWLFFLPTKAYDRTPLNQMLAIMGDCRGFWPFTEGSTATISDYSLQGNDLTANEDIGAWDTAPSLRAPIHVIAMNGTDEEADIADSDDFSFRVGADDDNVFSAGAWIKTPDGSGGRVILSKYDRGVTAREWLFSVNASDKLQLSLWDESAGVTISITTSAVIAPDTWTYVSGTYDGTEHPDGLDLYVNGIVVPSGSVSRVDDGSYVSMDDTAAKLGFGQQYNNGTGEAFFADEIAMPFLTAKELSAAEVWQLYQISRHLMGQ